MRLVSRDRAQAVTIAYRSGLLRVSLPSGTVAPVTMTPPRPAARPSPAAGSSNSSCGDASARNCARQTILHATIEIEPSYIRSW